MQTQTKMEAVTTASLHIHDGDYYSVDVKDYTQGKTPFFYVITLGGFSIYVSKDEWESFKSKMVAALESPKK